MMESGPTRDKTNLRSQPQGARLHSRPQRLVEAKGPSARSTAKWPRREEQFKDPGEAGEEETSPRELR